MARLLEFNERKGNEKAYDLFLIETPPVFAFHFHKVNERLSLNWLKSSNSLSTRYHTVF